MVSGYKQFLNALESLPELRELEREVRTTEDSLELLFRVNTLVNTEHDRTYETPHDVALACYLWVLSSVNPGIARVAAKRVRSCYGCWWARKLAEKLLAAGDVGSQRRASGTVVTHAGPVKIGTNHSTDFEFIFVWPTGEGIEALAGEATGPWVGRQMTLGDLLPRRPEGRNIGAGLLKNDGSAHNMGTKDQLLVVGDVA